VTEEDRTDRDLGARFARLREEERAGGEDYRRFAARVAARARLRARPRRRLVLPALAAMAAAIVLAVLILRGGSGGATAPAWGRIDLSATSLRMPTDFLLDTPGNELLRSVPALGAPDGTATGGLIHAPATPTPEKPS